MEDSQHRPEIFASFPQSRVRIALRTKSFQCPKGKGPCRIITNQSKEAIKILPFGDAMIEIKVQPKTQLFWFSQRSLDNTNGRMEQFRLVGPWTSLNQSLVCSPGSQIFAWERFNPPRRQFEFQLVFDLCRAQGNGDRLAVISAILTKADAVVTLT